MGNLWNEEALSRLLENLKKTMMYLLPDFMPAPDVILTQISSATVSLNPLMKLSGMKNPITALRKRCCLFPIPSCTLLKAALRFLKRKEKTGLPKGLRSERFKASG